MAVYTKINKNDIKLINTKFEIENTEVIKEDVSFKIPGKLN